MANNQQTFRGYIQNADYADPAAFLQQGEQTRLTADILAIAGRFNNRKDVSTLREISRWMRSNLSNGYADKFGRTAHQIVNSRLVTGCTDYGLVFAVLARAKGIPVVFVQSARIKWIKTVDRTGRQVRPVYGHVFVEPYIKGQWYLVDSMAGFLYRDYDADNFCLPCGYYVFAKSIDVWDTGVRNTEENNLNMMRLFTGFDISRYQKRVYKRIRLCPRFRWLGF